jgi:hypothetical protein
MAGRPVYLLVFWMPCPRLELRTLAGYNTLHLTTLLIPVDYHTILAAYN